MESMHRVSSKHVEALMQRASSPNIQRSLNATKVRYSPPLILTKCASPFALKQLRPLDDSLRYRALARRCCFESIARNES